jgi:hypothetical protein
VLEPFSLRVIWDPILVERGAAIIIPKRVLPSWRTLYWCPTCSASRNSREQAQQEQKTTMQSDCDCVVVANKKIQQGQRLNSYELMQLNLKFPRAEVISLHQLLSS